MRTHIADCKNLNIKKYAFIIAGVFIGLLFGIIASKLVIPLIILIGFYLYIKHRK